MNAADRLREIDQVLPTNEDVFSADTKNDAFHDLRNALPALVDLVDAAEGMEVLSAELERLLADALAPEEFA